MQLEHSLLIFLLILADMALYVKIEEGGRKLKFPLMGIDGPLSL